MLQLRGDDMVSRPQDAMDRQIERVRPIQREQNLARRLRIPRAGECSPASGHFSIEFGRPPRVATPSCDTALSHVLDNSSDHRLRFREAGGGIVEVNAGFRIHGPALGNGGMEGNHRQ